MAHDHDKDNATCGCDCEACMKGDHMKCTTPDKCSWEPPEEKE